MVRDTQRDISRNSTDYLRLAISKPVSAKIADVFGRLEAFTVAVALYTLGYILQASSSSVEVFAAAQIFYSAGSQGLQLLQQIFAADTTDLLNRAFFSTIFDIPFLWTTWAGSPIAQSILTNSTWRWGYGMWAIILPCVFAPLFITLWWNQRRAKKLGLLPPSFFQGKTALTAGKQLWFELDFFGLILLAAAITLILLPLTLAASYAGGWQNGRIIAMLVIGGVFLLAFPFWERSPRLAPHAFFPRELFQSRTVLAGIAIGFFYFSKFLRLVQRQTHLLTQTSGFLLVHLPLLLILPSGRARCVSPDIRIYRPDLLLHLDHRLHHHLDRNQVHRSLQVLCDNRRLHLPARYRPNDPLS